MPEKDHRKTELFAWIGEDELGSGEIGLKCALCAAGHIPMVATKREKMAQGYIQQQLQEQARRYGKTIRLCRFVLVEELVVLESGQEAHSA